MMSDKTCLNVVLTEVMVVVISSVSTLFVDFYLSVITGLIMAMITTA